MGTLTPKLSIQKPTPNVEEDWGFRQNENADLLDDAVLTANLNSGGNVVITDDGLGNVTISGSRNLLSAVTLDVPTDSEDVTMFKMRETTVLQEMNAVIRPTGAGCTWTIRHDPTRALTGTEVVVGGTDTTSIGLGDTILFPAMDNPTISGGSWVWVETTTSSGSVQELIVQLLA